MSHLLDHARLEAGKLALERQVTDVVVLVQQVVATARPWSAEHPISIVAPPSLEACVDALRLEQVLINLLDNAVKYSPEGGSIEVVVARRGAAMVEVAVRDHGLGIPVEQRAALFERFYQAHRGGPSRRAGAGAVCQSPDRGVAWRHHPGRVSRRGGHVLCGASARGAGHARRPGGRDGRVRRPLRGACPAPA